VGRRLVHLLASVLVLGGCAAASSSEVGPTSLAPPLTTSSSTAETTTTTEVPSTTTSPPPTTTPAAPHASPDLVAALDIALSRAPAGSCLMVREAGTVIYERNPDGQVLPASTMKLLTATGVLAEIPGESRFHTPVLAAAAPRDGQLDGDLWLIGTGDPTLGTGGYWDSFTRKPTAWTSLEALADRVVAAGVRHVTGRLVGDDSRFDATRGVPSWPLHYFTEGEIGALSSLMVNDGLAQWDPVAVPAPDAALSAAQVFAELLRQRGVQIDGGAAHDAAPDGLVAVAGIDSAPVAQLVADMLRESDNTTAELLLKELGRRVAGQPSTAAGAATVVGSLRRLGIPTDGVRMIDGSGLSRDDRVTCRTLVAVLDAAKPGGALDSGLPVAGATGTLAKRLLGTPAAGRVRAKTGSISGVLGLAGFGTAPGGARRTFAFELNDVGASSAGRILQDEVAVALATR
jgi:D-alanyl-D-alanine carboxypeptidase/D-alanyl-D-alanine-endopeptidase (penicillin-binding protein 4)